MAVVYLETTVSLLDLLYVAKIAALGASGDFQAMRVELVEL